MECSIIIYVGAVVKSASYFSTRQHLIDLNF
jgi:hypothetical protein